MLEKPAGFCTSSIDQNPRGIHGIFVGHPHENHPESSYSHDIGSQAYDWWWTIPNTHTYIYIHLWNIIVPGNETHTIQYHHVPPYLQTMFPLSLNLHMLVAFVHMFPCVFPRFSHGFGDVSCLRWTFEDPREDRSAAAGSGGRHKSGAVGCWEQLDGWWEAQNFALLS